MERSIPWFLFIVCSLVIAVAVAAAAENQTWKIRPGDTLDTVATTLDIPKEEIKKYNPGVLEDNLQIGQKLKLPLRSYADVKAMQQDVSNKDQRIAQLEVKQSELESKLAGAESQLKLQPIWFWGFWISFSIVTLIAFGAYWIFRETHPRVFEQPHERSISDLRESEIRVRPAFTRGEETGRNGGRPWRLSPKRFPHTAGLNK